jgi:hypothetical protein
MTMFGLMIGWDPFWWVGVPGLLLGMYAQMRLRSTYGRYLGVESGSGRRGADAAREILDAAGLSGMPVHEVSGQLTDRYDPMKKALFLSSENFHGTSLSAIGVAAHEAGHALQQQAAYAFFNFRMMLVPATGIASTASYVLFLIGLFFAGPWSAKLIHIAVGLFAVVALFQLITLPVEYDASKRAKEALLKLGLIGRGEYAGVNRVLNAAALTYVAAMVSAVLELVHMLLIARSRERG